MRRLYTAAGESVPETPWNDYPRPQMVRRDWLCLNGEWDFTANGREGKITVPFCAESLLSGAEKPVPCGQELIYRRRFSLPASWTGRRVLIRFGAVNRTAAVWCNGREICRHDNGYLPFSGELTDALLPGENELTVHVVNDLSHSFPWGKQSMDRGGMWYTPVTGIWQTVWLEPVPRDCETIYQVGGVFPVKDFVAAVSAGITKDGDKILDLCYAAKTTRLVRMSS